MANYFWITNSLNSTIQATQITGAPAAFGLTQSTPTLNITSPNGGYDMIIDYLTNFHVNTPTETSLQYRNALFNNVDPNTQVATSLFPINICPTRALYTTASGTINIGDANRMYTIIVTHF